MHDWHARNNIRDYTRHKALPSDSTVEVDLIITLSSVCVSFSVLMLLLTSIFLLTQTCCFYPKNRSLSLSVDHWTSEYEPIDVKIRHQQVVVTIHSCWENAFTRSIACHERERKERNGISERVSDDDIERACVGEYRMKCCGGWWPSNLEIR